MPDKSETWAIPCMAPMRPVRAGLWKTALFFLCALMAAAESTTAYAAQKGPRLVHAGPMIGHVDSSEANIWIRVKIGSKIEATAEQGGRSISKAKAIDLESGFQIIHFKGLQPAADTKVNMRISRAGSTTVSNFVSFKTAPLPGATGSVRIAFGSCSKLSEHKVAPIFRRIAQERPDFMIFLGDNSYFIVGDGSSRHFSTSGPAGDWSYPESMMTRHLRTRTLPDLQRLFRTVPSYAIWDDHDYATNNADSTFDLREESARVFARMWANPSYGTQQVPGIFSSFRHGPVEVFLMDNRYHKYSPRRHSSVNTSTGVIWGQGQLTWLMNKLKASTAPVKIIANGTQFLARTSSGEGHYREARGEQKQLLEFLEANRIGGVVFLTGDRHYTEAMQQVQGDGRTLVMEFTSSPFQRGHKVGELRIKNPMQEWGMRGNSYGLMTVEIPHKGEGTITFEARDESNKVPVVGGNECIQTWHISRLNY